MFAKLDKRTELREWLPMDARCIVKHNIYKVTNINVEWRVNFFLLNQTTKDNETKMHLHI
jgi:hypothetical protein